MDDIHRTFKQLFRQNEALSTQISIVIYINLTTLKPSIKNDNGMGVFGYLSCLRP